MKKLMFNLFSFGILSDVCALRVLERSVWVSALCVKMLFNIIIIFFFYQQHIRMSMWNYKKRRNLLKICFFF